MREQAGSQIEVISDPAEIDQIVAQTQDVNPETSLAVDDVGFRAGQGVEF
jgi:hypothetical protein